MISNETRLPPLSDDIIAFTNGTDDVNLSLEDRVELYKTTFDANGNQLILKNEHIVTKILTGEAEKGEGEEKNNKSTSIDIELGGINGNEGDNADDVDENGDVYYQPDCYSSTIITKSLYLDHTTKAGKKIMVNGTCIICFEEFSEDDVIVWSEDSNCNHIYHKECMVTYLASNSVRNDKESGIILNATNPCTTCRRQNYCIVRKEDLLQSITTTTTTTTCHQIMAIN